MRAVAALLPNRRHEHLSEEQQRDHQQASREQLRNVFFSLKRVILPGLYAALFISCSVIADRQGAWYLQTDVLVWCGFALAVFGHAFWLSTVACRKLKSETMDEISMRYYSWHYHVGATTSGVMWGMCSWVFLPAGFVATLCIILTCVGALYGGVLNVLNAPAAMRACVLSNGVIFSSGIVYSDPTLQNIFLGIGYFVMAVCILAMSDELSRVMRDLCLQKISEARLSAQLTEHRNELLDSQEKADRARSEAEAARIEAEEANFAKTKFLAAASHDLRQPMHSLVQYVGQVERLNVDPRLAAPVRGVRASTDAMVGLLDSLLDIGRIMIGGITPRSEAVDVASIIDALARELRPMAQQKGIRFKVRCMGSATVLSDSDLLQRILRNLLHNAVNFTSVGSVSLDCVLRGGAVMLRVADTGPGIPKDQRRRVFDAFYQVSNTARDRSEGLGLGLTFVKELSHLLKIDLRMRSSMGRGTVFSLRIPLADETHAANTSDSIAPSAECMEGEVVVVIDDDPLSLAATAATLRGFGCDVIEALDSDAAIREIEVSGRWPTAIVSDYRLKQETGIDAVTAVLNTCKLKQTNQVAPVAIIISGDTDPIELGRVRASGLGMLAKPVDPVLLLKELNLLMLHGASDFPRT